MAEQGYFARNWAELKSQTRSWLAQGAKDFHNQVIPAFPSYVHGVDQPGTPLNMPGQGDQPPFSAGKPSFEASLGPAPPSPAPAKEAERGIEL